MSVIACYCKTVKMSLRRVHAVCWICRRDDFGFDAVSMTCAVVVGCLFSSSRLFLLSSSVALHPAFIALCVSDNHPSESGLPQLKQSFDAKTFLH